MSEFKFACPVCGQHIKCDATKSGSQMECPTCFRKIVVPQAPASDDSKLILTAATVSSRPVPNGNATSDAPALPATENRAVTTFVIAAIVIACAAAGALYAFREKLFKTGGPPVAGKTKAPAAPASHAPVIFTPAPAGSETNWTLHLADKKFPDAPVAGRINGRGFMLERATVQGGILTLRHGTKTPQEMSVTIRLFAKQGEDLASRSVNIDSNRTNAPQIVLGWKNEQEQPAKQNHRSGYAMRIEFGPVAGGRLPGKIYLCVPDDAKSYVAGTFEAEIRKPAPPKAPKKPKTTPPR